MPESSRKSSEKLAAVERSIRALKHMLLLWLWLPHGLFAMRKWLSNNCDVRCYHSMAKWVLLWLVYWGYGIELRDRIPVDISGFFLVFALQLGFLHDFFFNLQQYYRMNSQVLLVNRTSWCSIWINFCYLYVTILIEFCYRYIAVWIACYLYVTVRVTFCYKHITVRIAMTLKNIC